MYVDLGDFATSKIAPQRQVILDAFGAKSPQKYMIALRTRATAGAGGAPLSAAILQFDQGKMTIPFNGYIAGDAFKGHPVIQYKPASPPPWGLPMPPGSASSTWAHPTGGSLARGSYSRARNTAKDPKGRRHDRDGYPSHRGVIRATGPIDVEGYGTLTADNFAQKVVTDAYLDFQSDQRFANH